MSRDLDDFLRKAAERRNQKKAQRQTPVQSPPPQSARQEQRPAAQQPAASQQPARRTPPKKQSSSSSRRTESAFGQQSQQDFYQTGNAALAPTGPGVDQADERMTAHLHDAFDHSMGEIGDPTSSLTADEQAKVANADIAAEIRAMLRDPNAARKAIVLREILERPEHNW